MANCYNCGADMSGMNFCQNCGASAMGNMRAPMGQDIRQQSLAELENMLRYFGLNEKMYAQFDTVSREVDKRSARGYWGWIGAAVVALGIGIFSKAAFFYVAAAAFVAFFVLLKILNKKKLDAAKARQDALYGKLMAYYEGYGYCPVGLEYTAPATLQILYDLVRKGRATNPGDAINVYLADMEQAQMHKLQEEATRAAKETAENTRKAAKHARRSAGYAAADFWLK